MKQKDFSISKLQLHNISKLFPGVRALSGVNLEIKAGEVHAICGENGAGKSTLMKILTGNHIPEGGDIFVDGKRVKIANQKHAQELGISIVYQERSLVEKLSVAENLFPINKPKNRFGLINYQQLRCQTRELLSSLGLRHIDPRAQVGRLSSANQQMVEIAKALGQHPEILILDEPTASITEKEVLILFRIIRDLKAKGVAIIYISHRMAEIFEIADSISVLKDGIHQGTWSASSVTVDNLIRKMVGRDVQRKKYTSDVKDEVALEVRNLTGAGFEKINFRIRKGEIVALSGLVGAGRTEVARAIFGADPLKQGEIYVEGQKQIINHPADAIRSGIAYVPEDRKALGLFMERSIGENIISADLRQVSNRFWISDLSVSACAESYKEKLNIKTPDITQKVVNLSGGNQQKVVLAKWLSLNPKILIVDEPTHGIDVGAKQEIYDILKELTARGVAVLMISSELPEVLAVSDRILVMSQGTVVAELDSHLATEEIIISHASNLEKYSPQLASESL